MANSLGATARLADTTVARMRMDIRTGAYRGVTFGLAPGFVQANLVILPADWAPEFMRYCHANPEACPLLAVSEPGSPQLPALGDDMRRLATEYVEVRGRGRFDKHDRWTTVEVEQVSGTRSWREPFDIDAFLNDPNPKIFDPEKVVTIDISDEAFEDFQHAIHEGRDAGYEAPSA